MPFCVGRSRCLGRVVNLVGVFFSQSSSNVNNAQLLVRLLSGLLGLAKLAEFGSLVNLIVSVFSSEVAESSFNLGVDGQMSFQFFTVPTHVEARVVSLDGNLEDFVTFHGGAFPFWGVDELSFLDLVQESALVDNAHASGNKE